MQIRAKRSLIAAALAAAVAAPVLAQGWMMQGGQGPGMMQGMGPGMMQGGPGGWGRMMGMRGMMGDPAQHMSGRLAFIEAELGITDAQRTLWDAYADAVRDAAGSMSSMHERMIAMDTLPALPERLAFMEEMMSTHLAALQTVREEATALYEALSPEQKETADTVMGMGMGMGMM